MKDDTALRSFATRIVVMANRVSLEAGDPLDPGKHLVCAREISGEWTRLDLSGFIETLPPGEAGSDLLGLISNLREESPDGVLVLVVGDDRQVSGAAIPLSAVLD